MRDHDAPRQQMQPVLQAARQIPLLLGEILEITDDGVDLAASGVRRPSSTWTYLVHDNPFDSDFEQTLKHVRSLMSRKR